MYPNREGEWPFAQATNYDGEHGPWFPDLSRPNPKYWAHVDRVVKYANSQGISVNFLPTWGRYVTGGYYGGPILFDEKNAHEYGFFLGERYPFTPWVLGGDTNRYWNPETDRWLKAGKDSRELDIIDYGPVFESMARGLQKGEESAVAQLDKKVSDLAKGYKPFITFHSGQREFGSQGTEIAL